MTPQREPDALSWDGDDDPTLDVGAKAEPEPQPVAEAEPESEPEPVAEAEPVELPGGFTPVGKGADGVGRVEPEVAASPPGEVHPLGNGVLVTLGIVGGIFLLYTIGWIVGGLRLQGQREYLVSDVMFQGSLWIAVLAPALWFATTFLLTRGSPAWVRIAWLAAGVVLLVPWPFIMTGAVGV